MIDPIEIQTVDKRLEFNENEELDVINKSKKMHEAIEATFVDLNNEVQGIRHKAKLIRDELEQIHEMFLHAVKMLRATASKSDLEAMEKKVDAWSPEKLVTKNELKKLLE